MTRIAFSTVACPDITLERVACDAAAFGFQGVELRTLGPGGAEFANDPALTSPEKLHRLFHDAGVAPLGLASGASFCAPVLPPVLGYVIGEYHKPVAYAKSVIDLAARLALPYVRVFAFEPPEQSARGRRQARRRIIDRLRLAADAAHNTGVRLLLENGGAFPTARDIASLIDDVASNDLAACYSILPASQAGEDPVEAVSILGYNLQTARIKDIKDNTPCPLGEGSLPCRAFVEAVRSAPDCRWLIVEWDRAWLPHLAPHTEVLPHAAKRCTEWLTGNQANLRIAAAAR